jgi:hypothetical protein
MWKKVGREGAKEIDGQRKAKKKKEKEGRRKEGFHIQKYVNTQYSLLPLPNNF